MSRPPIIPAVNRALALFCVLFALPAFGAVSTERDRALAAENIPHAARSTGAYLGEAAWKDWLREQFPDERERWPKAAVAGLALVEGKGSWDFVGAGDYQRDGIPTLLLIRTRTVTGTDGRPPWTAVDRLRIARRTRGAWKTALEIDRGRLEIGGEVPAELDNPAIKWFTGEFSVATDSAPADDENRAYPGLQLGVSPLDAKGNAFGDGCTVKYFREGRRYVVDCG